MDKIYLDLCCLKRSFDDQRQERVRREAAAVTAIVEQAERGECVDVAHSDGVAVRARDLRALGFGVLDGLHVAYAEAAGARGLVTCDDRLTELANRHSGRLKVAVVNPCHLAGASNS